MKKLLIAMSLVSSISVLAVESPVACYKLAEKSALRMFSGRQVEYSKCKKILPRGVGGKVSHRCLVAGSNGDGAGDFEMLFILNHDCTKVTFSKIISEE